MKDIKDLRDAELYELFKYSLKNMKHMGLIPDSDIEIDENYELVILNDYFDIESLRDSEKYQEMLKLASRMGYEKPHLPQDWKDCIVMHLLLLDELRRRQTHVRNSGSFIDNRKEKLPDPKVISEISPTYDSSDLGSSEISTFDYPVRDACWILYKKGYKTYMSSANAMDASNRKGHIIKDKHVAYILIDPENLSDDLKEKLLLNGSNIHWGVPYGHVDSNGNFYGIWAEIIGDDMECNKLRNELARKALELPDLKEKTAGK